MNAAVTRRVKRRSIVLEPIPDTIELTLDRPNQPACVRLLLAENTPPPIVIAALRAFIAQVTGVASVRDLRRKRTRLTVGDLHRAQLAEQAAGASR